MSELRARIYLGDINLVGEDSPLFGRWVMDLDTPDGSTTKHASRPGTLVDWAHNWGKQRGAMVSIQFVTMVGGTT